jgi:protein O-mannosyl-transferase
MHRHVAAAYLALLILGLAAFWPVCKNDFVNYDDPLYVTKNVHVQSGLTKENVRWAFGNTESSNWHPLTWLSHMLDCQFFGLDPRAQHAVNLGFHVTNALLLLLVLQQMTGALWRSAFVAALFATHPLHVESVAWIAERKDLLSTFFGLLTIWSYLGYTRHRSIPKYLLCLSFFVMSLMSKPMLVTLPALLLLIDFWPLKRWSLFAKHKSPASSSPNTSSKELLLEKIPFFALAVASSIVTIWAQHQGGSTESLDALPLGARIANALLSYILYLAKMFLPVNLAVFYPYHPVPVVEALGCGLLLAIVSWFSVAKARLHPYVLFGWLWFLIMLLPVIGLIQVGAQAFADRYTYLSSIGPFIILTWGIVEFFDQIKLPRSTLAIAGTVVLLGCVFTTQAQIARWKNSTTLFTHTLQSTSQNPVAENNLGSALFDAGNLAEAGQHFQAALKLRPNYPNAHFNAGILLLLQGRPDEAEAHFRAAIQNLPNYGRAHRFLGRLLVSQKRYEEAETHLRIALQFDPGDTEARSDLGTSLALQGKNDEAQSEFKAVLQQTPNSPVAHQNLGNLFATKGNSEAALSEYSQAIALDPTNTIVRESLASLLLKESKSNDAVRILEQGLRLRPTPDTCSMLASIYVEEGKTAEGVQLYRNALQMAPDSLAILNNLAWILATSRDDTVRNGAEAIKLAEKACSLSQYKFPVLLGTLAAAYAEAGRFADAISTAEKACAEASASGKTAVLKKNQELLELYRGGRAYHEP